MGRAQDPGTSAATVSRGALPGRQYGARRTRPIWPGHAAATASAQGRRHGTLAADATNDLWCADYKGEFMLADRRYCYPLTVTDFASRYLIACEALSTTQERYAFTVFERVFMDFGVPHAIRTDNGIPFACPNALYGLSKPSVWWLRLGIQIERIQPVHPDR